MQEYDKSSKWLIQHHGDSILHLAGVHDILEWRPLQAELVQPRRLPDGLIEVRLRERAESGLYIVEISTYPYTRLAQQAARDAMLVFLDREVLPEVLVLVLHPQGNKQAAVGLTLQSVEGLTRLQVTWRTIELWTIPAKDLLAAGDVGVIPWVPLADYAVPPEAIFRECRDRIERDAPPGEVENLLAVTQFLAGLRYNDPRLFEFLGGRQAMIQSPVIQELIADYRRRDIVKVLVTRFGAQARALESELKIVDEDQLDDLLGLAVTCPDLDSFRKQIPH